jgi:ribonuclease-3
MTLHDLQKVLGYQFRKINLLQEALTHPSLTQNKEVGKNYERLEFLGDAVLGLIITELLIKEYPDEKEGALAKRRAALVCGKTLAQISQKLDLGSHIAMTVGEDLSGGRQNVTNLENSLEAIIGALYLDGGFTVATEFVHCHWFSFVQALSSPPQDPKTSLQEWAQKNGKPLPEYLATEVIGPSHSPLFTIQVSVQGLEPAIGKGLSKRVAERLAAENMLNKILGNP